MQKRKQSTMFDQPIDCMFSVGCWWLSSVVVDGASEWEKNLGGGVSAIQAVMVVSGPTEVSDGRLIRGTTEKTVSCNGGIVPGTSVNNCKIREGEEESCSCRSWVLD
ncbi:hypothetical protein LXL04_010143 [Taraxacum kok-saghyz]